MPDDDHRHMARAIALARRGLCTTDPNPRVGCVVVDPRGGGVLAQAWHRRAGEPHAEVIALERAGARARGATVYVSLEPCAHRGRTGPCAEALVAAGVGRVVSAMEDPNPRVAGAGFARLREAGIEVRSGVLEQAAEALNPGFVKRMRTGRPLVRCKVAMSLDGRTAMASGESQWITGSAARADVQRLRARSSAVLTGIGTVLADDPALTVRAPAGGTHDARAPLDDPPRQPLRVVLDSRLRTPPHARVLAGPGRVHVYAAGAPAGAVAALEAAGATVIALPGAHGRVDLRATLARLAADEANEVLVEAGATLVGSLLAGGLVDEMVIYAQPLLLGDAARGLARLPGLDRLADAVRLALRDLRMVGETLRITAEVAPEAGAVAAAVVADPVAGGG